jgi:hypothetical protein
MWLALQDKVQPGRLGRIACAMMGVSGSGPSKEG